MKIGTSGGQTSIGRFTFEEIARQHGTPFYLYDLPEIRERTVAVRRSFGGAIQLYYAVKANPNLELLRALRGDVDGLDVSSGGEIQQAQLAGYDPATLSFAGPGKTADELEAALAADLGVLSLESLREIDRVAALASARGRAARVAIRVNPRQLVREYPMKMGGVPSPFGVDEEDLPEAVRRIAAHGAVLDLVGTHVYAGTACMDAAALATGVDVALQIARAVDELRGTPCRFVNVGGGFGVSYYEPNLELDCDAVGARARGSIEKYRESTGGACRVIVELGRFLVAPAGIYVARVVDRKTSRGETFVVLDGGLSHHLAASGNLGNRIRRNFMTTNLSAPDRPMGPCNLVGPACTPLDLMGHQVQLPEPEVGDLVGFLNSGAYGLTASPLLFLGHPSALELLHDGETVRVVRGRKDIADFN